MRTPELPNLRRSRVVADISLALRRYSPRLFNNIATRAKVASFVAELEADDGAALQEETRVTSGYSPAEISARVNAAMQRKA